MRLPTRIHLPFGYVVKVKQITVPEMRVFADGGPDLDGCWIAGERTIYVLRNLPIRRKRYILGHEVIHAVNDWLHAALNMDAARP